MSSHNRKKVNKQSTKQNSNKSLSWGAKIHTLNTIDTDSKYSSSFSSTSTSTSSSSSSSSSSTFQIQYIPNLPSSEYAQSLLQRIQKEFTLIVQKRGYNVSSVTEMCCCDDGFNYLGNNNENTSTSSNYNNNNSKKTNKRKRKKIKNMPNNILGYNLTHGYRNSSSSSSSQHRIHLRLRQPKSSHSQFYEYEEIAGTMCHELAHCVVGKHNAKFYKVMDDIMVQYEMFLIKGLVVDQKGFPLGYTENEYVLGGSRRNGSSISGGDIGKKKNQARKAALERWKKQKKNGLGGIYILGGGSSSPSTLGLAYLPPREAARIAAERRIENLKKNDSKYCLPCEEVIEILDDSEYDDDEYIDNVDNDHIRRSANEKVKEKKKCKNVKAITNGISNVIDLIDDSSSEDEDFHVVTEKESTIHNNVTINERNKTPVITYTSDNWICPICTYHNKSLSGKVAICQMCGMNREDHKKENNNNWSCASEIMNDRYSVVSTEKEIEKLIRQDFIEDVKRNEREQSQRNFNGFNIYGNDKQSSSTMKHLT